MSPRPVVARRTVRLACVVSSAVVLGTAVVVIGTMTPGYRPMAETVSRLGSAGQPHAAWMQAVFVLYGLLVLVGAGPVGDYVTQRPRLLSEAIAGYAAAGVVAGLAPKDPPDVPVTTVSQIHVAATIVGGAMILVAMISVARFGPARGDRRAAVALAAFTVVGVVVFRFTWGSSTYGLVERSFLGASAGWVSVIAARRIALDHRDAQVGGPTSVTT